MMRCDRCSAPVEEPTTYADEICGPTADITGGCCDHVALCIDCAERHRQEVAEEIEYARAWDAQSRESESP
jgi:hypothetical protein